MLRKQSTTLIKALFNTHTTHIMQKRLLHPSTPLQMGCTYLTSEEAFAERLAISQKAADKHQSTAEFLATENKQQEIELCKSRALLAHYVGDTDLSAQPKAIAEETTRQLKLQKEHRTEEHDQFADNLKQKRLDLEQNINSLEMDFQKAKFGLKGKQDELDKKKSATDEKIDKLKQDIKDIDSCLDNHGRVNKNSTRFLVEREVEDNMSQRFRF